MRTAIAAHELLPKGLYLENLRIGAGRVSISVASGMRRPSCPLCGHGSSRVHSRYSRTVSDLPWHGTSVELEVLVHLQATFSGRDRCSWCGQSKAEHTRSANS